MSKIKSHSSDPLPNGDVWWFPPCDICDQNIVQSDDQLCIFCSSIKQIFENPISQDISISVIEKNFKKNARHPHLTKPLYREELIQHIDHLLSLDQEEVNRGDLRDCRFFIKQFDQHTWCNLDQAMRDCKEAIALIDFWSNDGLSSE